MALTSQTWFYLITSLFLAIFAISYALVMLYAFIKKKTLGTAFLLFTFTLLGLGEGANTLSYWFEAFNISSKNLSGIFQILFLNLYALSILFFYFFYTRHILRDNDFVKSLMGVFLGETIAVVTTTMFSELLLGEDLYINTSDLFLLPNTNIEIFAPVTALSLVLFIPLLIFVLLRISYNVVIIGRKITEPVPKRGILYIGISIVSLIGSTVVLMLFYLPSIYSNSKAMLFLQALRLAATILRLIFGYLGWILPDWLKKRIRGKAWIVRTMKEREGMPITYSFSSSHDIKKTAIQVQEVSEQ